jgi:hypothetical protein
VLYWEERARLRERLVVTQKKTRSILGVFHNDALADDNAFEDILKLKTLEDVLTAMMKTKKKVFYSNLPVVVER